MADDESKVIETWETTTEGTVWVWKKDARENKYVEQRVGGRQGGSKRVHITRDDRRFNQEQVVDEMKEHDVFTNGQLVLVSADRAEDIDATYHLTTDDLTRLLEIKDDALFEQEVSDVKSELILRRLREVAESKGTVAQLEFIRDLISERYRVGGTQRTVREMMAAGEMSGGEALSGR